MDRQRTSERDEQIARIREIFESTKDQSADETPTGEIDTRGLLGDDLGPAGRTPKARVRVAMAERPALAYIVVAVVAAALAAGLTWLSRPAAEPVEGAAAPTKIASVEEGAGTSGSPPTAPGDGGADASGGPQTSASPATIVVSVVGTVVTPGLVTLADGARVSDAIDAAGGALPGTDLSTINLARKVADGEQIAVGVPGATDQGGGSSAPDDSAPSGAASAAKVNVNSASAQELDSLPGIGPVLAQSIIVFRETNGPFGSVDELTEVSGIGPAVLAKIKDLVTV
ncbi:competence protein ComEA [Epidermidibacterium keratini]|uniref:Competence protein ComEA n=1 Tax=Epidermidibacterium keratini TaxID=1891644 RepID=A0A7L4YLB5_9ACTN|nr:ComEA family DNA-binding protein [Epidermidibacterium keratini]QHB99346.1 competence protein ComEA [Epidermidibacterium keratini]